MKFDPEKHHRRSIRLPNYNYGQAGAYFVTMCTYKKQGWFGDVKRGEMQLNVTYSTHSLSGECGLLSDSSMRTLTEL
ncbi:hypothetical protein [Dolichospermum sp. LEGE 00246]|uniref:hypothetical protein n=1 Tax=Dolichospermum sp. LEGE 00246 TaxID=1828605 RepID=UPI001D148209|nr:hypothetical protein [Dolichospermum sp. LEGE 00246]